MVKGTLPEDQFVPLGTGAGKPIVRDNYTPPPKVRVEHGPMVEEVEPYFSSYGQWTKDMAADMLVPPPGTPEGCYYDHEDAQRYIDFAQKLYIFEGSLAGNHLRLMYWQERVIRYVFGWKNPDGSRLIREVYLEIPRKNGKSFFAAVIALLLAFCDEEAAPQVFFAASDKEQASYSYNMARAMIEMDVDLCNDTVIYNGAKKMLIPETRGELKALSGKSPKLYGLNLHGLIFDELMVQKTRELWDALTTAQGARWQALIFAITTAGWNRKSIAYEQRTQTQKIADGKLKLPTFLGIVYSIPEDADWTDPENWKKACPSMGETVQMSYYEEACKKAIANPAAQNSFRTLYLCQWVGQANRIINMKDWDISTDVDFDEDILLGEECFMGIDLSYKTDLTAIVLDFPNMPEQGWHLWKAMFFLPEEGLEEKGHRDEVDYVLWKEQGFLRTCPGPVIEDDFLQAYIRECREEYNVIDAGYDQWGMVGLARRLEEDDEMVMVKVAQSQKGMSPSTKELLDLITKHQFTTLRNPILRWMAENVSGVQDHAGNVMFDKAEKNSRIDGLVAGVIALDGAIRRGGDDGVSIYETQSVDDIYDDDKWKEKEEVIS